MKKKLKQKKFKITNNCNACNEIHYQLRDNSKYGSLPKVRGK